MTKLLLCTDLDRTLLPNGPKPESDLARVRFSQLAAREEVTLVYVTGRDKRLVLQAIRDYRIPQPDYVIANVGTTIYRLEGDNWNHLQAWQAEISNDWNHKSAGALDQHLKEFDELHLQEVNKQHTYKLSYYAPVNLDHLRLIRQIKACLESWNVKATIVWSIDDLTMIGLLDILPASASKKQAIEFLMQQLKFDYGETVFAGDSGNDISVMASPIQSVLVANATEDVRKSASEQAGMKGLSEKLYFAKGNYLAMNGNYAAGILEGIVHYMPIVENWIKINNE